MKDELRIAVCRAIGWKRQKSTNPDFDWVWIEPNGGGYCYALPELSLDLMHELENGLTDDEYRQWLNHLIESRNKDCIPLCRCHSATAEQRAQAWVKLKGKGEK